MAGKPTEEVNQAAFETNLAQRVVARFSLSPPIDAAMIAERYAITSGIPLAWFPRLLRPGSGENAGSASPARDCIAKN